MSCCRRCLFGGQSRLAVHDLRLPPALRANQTGPAVTPGLIAEFYPRRCNFRMSDSICAAARWRSEHQLPSEREELPDGLGELDELPEPFVLVSPWFKTAWMIDFAIGAA